jgi:hypothetical protein
MFPFEEPFAGVVGSIPTSKLKRPTLGRVLNENRKTVQKVKEFFTTAWQLIVVGREKFFRFLTRFAKEFVVSLLIFDPIFTNFT